MVHLEDKNELPPPDLTCNYDYQDRCSPEEIAGNQKEIHEFYRAKEKAMSTDQDLEKELSPEEVDQLADKIVAQNEIDQKPDDEVGVLRVNTSEQKFARGDYSIDINPQFMCQLHAKKIRKYLRKAVDLMFQSAVINASDPHKRPEEVQ